jgi:hypothetical protein
MIACILLHPDQLIWHMHLDCWIVRELRSIISSLTRKERDRATLRHPGLCLRVGRVYERTRKQFKLNTFPGLRLRYILVLLNTKDVD